MVDLGDIVEGILSSHSMVSKDNLNVYALLEARKHPQYTVEEIERELLIRLAKKHKDVGLLKKKTVQVKIDEIPKLSGLEWGLPRREHNRKMNIVTQMRSIIVASGSEGIAKTSLFRQVRKDNSHWREELTVWLDELIIEGFIKRNGKRYFHCSVGVESKEQMLHRIVWESLEDGPLSMTKIARKIGYGGGIRRPLVKAAVEDLACAGYIVAQGIRWKWAK